MKTKGPKETKKGVKQPVRKLGNGGFVKGEKRAKGNLTMGDRAQNK
jgi:hypothetical protein